MTDMDRPIRMDRTVNLNTIIALAGFALTIGGGVFVFGSFYSKLQDFQGRQETYNASLDVDRRSDRVTYDARLESVAQSLTKLAAISDQSTYQIAQLQKKDDETDARLGRMTESYSDKFTEIQATLSTMSTQLALQSQAITEVKQLISPSAAKGQSTP